MNNNQRLVNSFGIIESEAFAACLGTHWYAFSQADQPFVLKTRHENL